MSRRARSQAVADLRLERAAGCGIIGARRTNSAHLRRPWRADLQNVRPGQMVIAGYPRDPSTTTFALTGARRYRSITSWLIMRMQPDDTLLPMVHGSTVPWMR